GERYNANVKVVEVPPGPPVLAPLVAEIYGLDYTGQLEVAQQVRNVFEATPDIVDVDTTIEAPQRKLIVRVDRQRAARLGVSQADVAAAINTAVRGEDASYLHDENAAYPVPVRLEFSEGDKADLAALKSLRVRSRRGELVPLGEVASFEFSTREQAIHHKDLLPVVYVTADMAG